MFVNFLEFHSILCLFCKSFSWLNFIPSHPLTETETVNLVRILGNLVYLLIVSQVLVNINNHAFLSLVENMVSDAESSRFGNVSFIYTGSAIGIDEVHDCLYLVGNLTKMLNGEVHVRHHLVLIVLRCLLISKFFVIRLHHRLLF